MRFDRWKIPLDVIFWDSNLFFFLDGSPFVRGSWCKISLGDVSFEMVNLSFYIWITIQNPKVTCIFFLLLLYLQQVLLNNFKDFLEALIVYQRKTQLPNAGKLKFPLGSSKLFLQSQICGSKELCFLKCVTCSIEYG